MDYFSILSLNKEPFSNSPDPEFFYNSRQHLDCLQKLELSLRLRRGLNVVIGDVGTGKTTLCRHLIRRFGESHEMETHLILDPSFSTSTEFLTTVAQLFTGSQSTAAKDDWQLKELIKQYLFRTGVDGNKTTILIIDEGQKIPLFCLEILREFLNYETNQYKLLQIIIFAQEEFAETIAQHQNFSDRISLYHRLNPLSFRDTRMMIQFRLEQSLADASRGLELFTLPALIAIYRATGGYPRKIINLCHQSILAMIIQNRTKVRYSVVRGCMRRIFAGPNRRWRKAGMTAFTLAALLVLVLGFSLPDRLKELWSVKKPKPQTLSFQMEPPQPSPSPLPPVAVESPLETNPPTQTASEPSALAATEIQSAPVVAIESEPDPPGLQDPPARAAVAAKSLPASEPSLKPPVSVPAPEPLEAAYAEILGRVSLQRNDTISGLIRKIHGSFNSSYLKSFLAANPQISNPDRVEIGQIVSFPAITADFKPLDQDVWWIILQMTDSLAEAFDVLRAYPDRAPPARVIPYWNRQEGFEFAVVIRPCFTQEKRARDLLGRLPDKFAANARISSLWNPDNVYFTDPFSFKSSFGE